MYHIVELPSPGSAKYYAVFVVIDWFTKMAHFIPCHVISSTTTLAHHFHCEGSRLYGLPVSIISDRGTTFCSRF